LKTLAEIAIDARLVDKAGVAKAGKLADDRKVPLVVIFVRELGIDEVALIAALKKQTRVPILDPAIVRVEPDALRVLPKEACARLRVLPLAITTDLNGKLLKLAMADPTDSAAVAEVAHLAHCDVDVSALPLSAIEELVDKGYRQITTVITRTALLGRRVTPIMEGGESEVSVTAQIPIAALQSVVASDTEMRLHALIQLLVSKGVISEDDIAEALRKLKGDGGS
jgi:hypothetical protein